MKDYHYDSDAEISQLVTGKTITVVSYEGDRGDDFLVFMFTDGTELRIRYDYIYEWEFKLAPGIEIEIITENNPVWKKGQRAILVKADGDGWMANLLFPGTNTPLGTYWISNSEFKVVSEFHKTNRKEK